MATHTVETDLKMRANGRWLEVSWNHETDTGFTGRVKVEFIANADAPDWEKAIVAKAEQLARDADLPSNSWTVENDLVFGDAAMSKAAPLIQLGSWIKDVIGLLGTNGNVGSDVTIDQINAAQTEN